MANKSGSTGGGGSGFFGGSGGSYGQAGAPGENSADGEGRGGGGGGAGAAGGHGGSGIGGGRAGAGGSAGGDGSVAIPSGNPGSTGGSATSFNGGGGGGGGGNGLLYSASNQSRFLNFQQTAPQGGAGGAGGAGAYGGGGGAGGYGLVVTGSNDSIAIQDSTLSPVGGGAGGAGGRSGTADTVLFNSYGGDGGGGAYFGGAGSTLQNLGAIFSGGQGGKGGTGGSGGNGNGGSGGNGVVMNNGGTVNNTAGSIEGGAGGAAGGGTAGAGGAGIFGRNITVINGASGTIEGGMSGDGTTQGDAIDFTGGTGNSLELGGTISGNIGVDGTATSLTIDNTANNQTLSNAITGTGSVSFAPDAGSSLNLTGISSYSGSTTIQGSASGQREQVNLEGSISGSKAISIGQLGELVVESGSAIAKTAAVTTTNNGELNLVQSTQIGSLNGTSGEVFIGSNLILTAGTNNTDDNYGGIITGPGGLIKVGTGTFTVSYGNGYGGTTIEAGTFDLANVGAAGRSPITFAPSGTGTATLALDTAAQPSTGTALSPGPAFSNTLASFNASGDSLDLKNFMFDGVSSYVSDGQTLTVTGGSGGLNTETFELTNCALAYTAKADSAGTGTLITAVTLCFAGGTRIRVLRGGAEAEAAVEDLRVGDVAVTACGAHRPIRWLGRREIDCRRHPRPRDAMPVRIAAHAFGADLPARDLLLSAGHPVLVGADEEGRGGHLVPIMCLINGTTIARMAVDRITYWHVELDAHDILLAEGLPAESYIDLGSRAWFAGADKALYNPDMALAGMPGRCRPVALDGPLVEAERRRLDMMFAARLAGAAAWPSQQTEAALW